ncbi:protein serine/threonine kinase [Pelomyxa schiedti]|nr:protein serine/threonine kinase [Pelomyxa schiedti]
MQRNRGIYSCNVAMIVSAEFRKMFPAAVSTPMPTEPTCTPVLPEAPGHKPLTEKHGLGICVPLCADSCKSVITPLIEKQSLGELICAVLAGILTKWSVKYDSGYVNFFDATSQAKHESPLGPFPQTEQEEEQTVRKRRHEEMIEAEVDIAALKRASSPPVRMRKFCIVTEYFPLGNLHSCMKTNTFSLPLKVKCLIDCATGMSFIHKAGLLHRDLKPDNLLVASLDVGATVNCKITDFGTCRDINKTNQTQAYTVGVGTPTYMPPVYELLSNGKYKQSADVYSFAVLMYQVISEREPYSDLKSLWKITEFVLSGQRMSLEGIPPELAEIITASWDQDYHKRPSFAQATTLLEAVLTSLKS